MSESEISNLLERITAFELDEPDSQFPFTGRLAREQGWTHAHAGRVVMEYKRFLFLAVAAGHPVSPSEAVDHAWHLHLLYTRSYWQRLCRDTLHTDLHHQPTTGGGDESRKFADWYSRTLDSYSRFFNEPAPPDLWPRSVGKSGNKPRMRWIDSTKFWLIPRPAWLSATTMIHFFSKPKQLK